jgi:segregation and condensation protein A
MEEIYKIKTELFEGPFDLLLFFIQRDEIDIYDIPIAKITEDFLDYIHTLEHLNIDVASEFILTAATLIRIKAKMLLPRKELDDEGNMIDPRTDLVKQLVEYKKIKEVLNDLETMQEERQKLHLRGNSTTENKILSEFYQGESELEPVSLFRLFSVFSKLVKNLEEKGKPATTLKLYRYKPEEERVGILSELKASKRIGFGKLFIKAENRLHAVVRFLALLELLTAGEVKIVLGAGKNNFWIEMKNGNNSK